MANYKSNQTIPSEMRDLINISTGALGLTGVWGGIAGPGADLPVIIPAWIGMTVGLAGQAELDIDKQTAKKVAMAVCTGAGALMGGTKLAATGIAWLTAPLTLGWSLVASAAANATLNATFTRAYGRAVAKFFLQTEKIDNIDVMVRVLIALIGFDLGFSTPHDDLIS